MSRFTGFRRFVVGVDEKGLADHAVHAACRIASHFGARLELVHAVPVPPAMWIGIDREELARIHDAALERAKERLRGRLVELERKFGFEAGELSEHLRVLPGKPANVLLERAERGPADVVFLGPHERHGLLDFGSTARGVLHRARCGLWVQPGEYRTVERILAPVDLSDLSLAALRSARAVAQKLEAELEVLHCMPPPDLGFVRADTVEAGWPTYYVDQLRDESRREFERAMAAFDWQGVQHEDVFIEGDAEEEILARQEDCQLVVMGTHGRTGLRGALLGNVTYTVMRRAKTPVLAYRDPGLG